MAESGRGVDLGILGIIKWGIIIIIFVAIAISIATVGDYTAMKTSITDVGRSFLALLWAFCDVLVIIIKGADTAQVIAKGGELVSLLLAFVGHSISLIVTAFDIIIKGISGVKL